MVRHVLGREHMSQRLSKMRLQKNRDCLIALDRNRKEMICWTEGRSSKEDWKWQGGLTAYPKLSQDGEEASCGIKDGFRIRRGQWAEAWHTPTHTGVEEPVSRLHVRAGGMQYILP